MLANKPNSFIPKDWRVANNISTSTLPTIPTVPEKSDAPPLETAESVVASQPVIAPSNNSTDTGKKLNLITKLVGPVTLLVVLGLWYLLTALAIYPPYILPTPATVMARFGSLIADGSLWHHAGVTLLEAMLGFAVASLIAAVLGYPIAHSRLVSALLSPLLAATQAIPLVALAPLLIIWFGFGITPKIVTCALIVFFPLLLNTVAGYKSVEKSLLEASAVFGANRWQTLWLVELPLALPGILTGVKIGFTLSITGAVVGEFIASDAGLGYLLNLGRGQFDTPLVFVALLTLTTIALVLYGSVTLLEKRLLSWR